jgi:hypothetical protein
MEGVTESIYRVDKTTLLISSTIVFVSLFIEQ